MDDPVRVLWLSNETPDVAGQGGQRRQYFQIRELVAAGMSVDVITLAGPQDDSSIRELGTVRRVRRHGRLGVPDPLGRAVVARALRSRAYRTIVVAHLESWSFVERMRPDPASRIIVDLHNVMSAWARRHGEPDAVGSFEAKEVEVLRRAGAVSTCSQAEAERLPPVGTALRIVLPHGIEPSEWPRPHAPAGAPAVGAIGNWNWPPNTAGMSWLVRDVWPQVSARVPGAQLVVAGAGLPEALASAPGVLYLGRVPDRLSVVAAVDAMAVPVLAGVGAAVKFGEALASGRAVIATADGASAHPSAPAFVSDDPAEWSHALTRWLLDRGAAAASGAEARRYALDTLTWRRTTQPLIDWIRGDVVDPLRTTVPAPTDT